MLCVKLLSTEVKKEEERQLPGGDVYQGAAAADVTEYQERRNLADVEDVAAGRGRRDAGVNRRIEDLRNQVEAAGDGVNIQNRRPRVMPDQYSGQGSWA